MNVLMVLQNLNFKDHYNYPLGYFYLASAIKKAGHNIEWLEFTNDRPTVDEIAIAIKEKIEKFSIEVVMCGSLFAGWREFDDIMTGAKRADNTLITIGGGGGLTYSSNEFMEQVPALDIGVLGEGEIVAVNLLKALQDKENLNTVKGIVYRSADSSIIRTEPGECVNDLDSLHYPLLSPEFEKNISQTKHMLIAGSRSCPFDCTFCCCVTTKKYRKRTIDKVIAEIKFYKEKYDIRKILFIDELLSEDLNRIYELCDKLVQLDVKFIFQMRASKNFGADFFQHLIKAGMISFSFGVENTNNEILESMKKKTGTTLLNSCFDALKKSGVNKLTEFNLLIGDPKETITTFSNTIRFLRENYKDYKLVSPVLIKCYPGSQIYNDAVKNKIIDPDRFFLECGYAVPIINITKLSDGVFEAIKMTVLYERSINRQNNDLDVQIYIENDKYYIKWCCACHNDSKWKAQQLGNWLEYIVGTEITFICSYCDKIVVDIVKNKYYDLLGQKLSDILLTRKVLFFGVNEVLQRFLNYICGKDYAVTAPDLKFSADDWRIIEEELYDTNLMSDMLENKFLFELNSKNLLDIDMVVVVSVNQFDEAKKAITALNPEIPVLMYSDILYIGNCP